MIDGYKTSKTRVCVTVGMMTTGYDCTDILNICLMRPIFSPTDFIQIKGRGTRTHNFTAQLIDPKRKAELEKADPEKVKKKTFKLFDFFANCEYFEEKFNYDETLKLPRPTQSATGPGADPGTKKTVFGDYETFDPDKLRSIQEQKVGLEGMKIDRMFFEKFEDVVNEDDFIKENAEQGNWEGVIEYVNTHVMDKPEEFFTLEKLRKAAGVDRRLSIREIIEKSSGIYYGVQIER